MPSNGEARTAVAFCMGSAVAAFQLVFDGNSICGVAWSRLWVAASACAQKNRIDRVQLGNVMFSIAVGGYTIVDIP